MRNSLVTLCGLLFLSTYAFAESKISAPSLSIKDTSGFESLFNSAGISSNASGDNLKILDDSIEVKVRVRGVGRFKARLNKQKFFKFQDSNLALLQGTVTSLSGKNKKRGASFASLRRKKNGNYSISLFSVNATRGGNWNGLLEVKAELALDGAGFKPVNVSANRSSSRKPTCLTEAAKSGKDSTAPDSIGTKAAVKIIRMLIEADNEYAGQVDLSSELPTILNGVDTIYQRDLSLSVVADLPTTPANYTQQIQLTDDFSYFIMDEMMSKHPGSSREEDIHALFTAKTPVDAELQFLAGAAADIGAVCKKPNLSVTFIIRFDTMEDILTAAHEIGHLIGGEHDDDNTSSTNPGIMNSGTAAVDGPITKFSTFSKNQIGNFINNNSSCLDDGEGNGGGGLPSTLPATAIFDAYKDGKFFIVELYDSEDESGYSDYQVDILYKKKSKDTFSVLKSIFTDEDGYAEFKPRKEGTYSFQVENLKSKNLKYKKPRK